MNGRTCSLVTAIRTRGGAMAERADQKHPMNQTPPLRTDADWIRAGEIFNAPLSRSSVFIDGYLVLQIGGTL